MKVDKIQKDYSVYRKNTLSHSNVSFQKGPAMSVGEKITDSLKGKDIIKGMKNLEWLKGEIGGILITAIGTGLVAPFPIAFNPFVKPPKNATPEEIEDLSNTKKYTAMRQPISAILAILFQVSALKPIDMFLDKLFNKAEYAKNFGIHFDQSAINNKSYVEKLAKDELKEQKETLAKEEYQKLFKQKVKEIEDKQINELAKSFQETGRIKIGERYLDNETLAKLINKQIDSYIDDANKLRIDHEHLAFYTKRAKTLIDNEAHLRDIFRDLPLEPKDSSALKEKLEVLLSKESIPEVKEILQEIIERPEDIQGSRIKRTLSRIDSIKKMCGGNYTEKGYLEAMSLRNGHLDGIITSLKLDKIQNPKNVSDNGIREALSKITESCKFDITNEKIKTILHDTDTFDFNADRLGKKIHKDITKQYKDLLKNKYKGLNQVIKIAVGVFITLPITCNALNWVYPRIMRVAFPSLAGVKNNKKSENVKEVK